MPAFKLTGYHSHRHPFLGLEDQHAQVSFAGEGDMIDLDNPLAPGMYEALADDAAIEPKKVLRPFVSGTVNGLVVWGIAKAFKVDKRKARQVAFAFGASSILFGLASDYLFREVQALAATQNTTEAKV
jgi:hypothetical protein